MLSTSKHMKTLCLDDLAITRRVNVFSIRVKNQLAQNVAQLAVLTCVSSDQNEFVLRFEQRPDKINVAIKYLHACIRQDYRVKSVLSGGLESFLIYEPPVLFCCIYHSHCEILISHWARSFHLDK